MKSDGDFCPYVGLRPFTKDDRRYFFGRDREQRVIFSNLSASPLTVLYGPSGTGKSSVLQAGLIPLVRIHSRRTGIVYFNSWLGESFLDDLKTQCIAEAQRVARNKNFTVDAALPLDELIVELQRHLSRPMLIVLDQFEEYLFYHPESDRDRPFESQLARAVALDEGASFLIALREDSLSRLDRFRTRMPNLLGNTLRLQALNARGAEEAIREPLKVYQKRHGETNGPVEIEDALVGEILNQVRLVPATHLGEVAGEGAPSMHQRSDNIEAAILQLVMKRLWDEERMAASRKLRLQTLVRLGGAVRIAETHFARVMDHFSPVESETCAAIFRFLVTPSGGKVAYTPDDLAASAERDVGEVNTVLQKLVDYSVLRKTDAPERYELLHDILAPAVIGWRNRYVRKQQLATEVARHEAQLAAERKSRTLRGAIVAAVLFMVLAGLAVAQWLMARHTAERNKRNFAQLVAAKFQQESVKSDPASGKDLLFLLRARDILKANFTGKLRAEQLVLIDARLAEAINSWPLPAAGQYAFTNPRRPGGDFVTVNDRFVTWWDAEKRQKGAEIDVESQRAVDSVQAISGDGRRIALSTIQGAVIWELVKDQETVLERAGRTFLRVVALSDVDDRLLVKRGPRLEVWEDAADSKPRPLTGNLTVLFRAKTSQIVAMEGDVLKLMDLSSRLTTLREFRVEKGKITQFAVSPNGEQLAFAEQGGAIRLANLNSPTKKEPYILSAMVMDWKTLAFDRDSRRLAGFGADGRVFVWNIQNGKREPPVAVHPADEAVFSHDLRWVATSSPAGVTVHALTPPSDVVAEAQKRAKGDLDFEDIVNTYGELTKDFPLGVESARNGLNAAEAASHFRAAIAVFSEVDPGLRFNPDVEAHRLTAEGFLTRAQREAREGEYNKAKEDYAQGLKLNPKADSQLPERLRQWALEALLRRADLAAAEGNLDAALKDLREARSLGAQVDPAAEKRLTQNVAEMRVNEGRSKLDSGEPQAAVALFDEALKLNPALAASLNPEREIEKAQARDLMRKAVDSLKADRIGEAIREFAKAQKLAGPIGEREFAESRALARAGYDTLTGALEIEFRSGAAYRYAAVPPDVYDALLRAESKGRYYSEQIRGKYSSERLERKLLAPVPLGEQPTISGFVGELLKATNKAATLAPTNVALRQVRGVARALAGDFTGAAEDLIAFANDPSHADSDFGRENKAWAEQLRQQKNPFTPEVLDKLPIP